MSDSFDRRVLSTYLEEYLGDFVFDPARHFTLAGSGSSASSIHLPLSGDRDVYVAAIEELPLVQSPGVGVAASAPDHSVACAGSAVHLGTNRGLTSTACTRALAGAGAAC